MRIVLLLLVPLLATGCPTPAKESPPGDTGCDVAERQLFFADADGDGFGAPSSTVTACEAPDGWAETSDDCDDDDPAIHPGAEEVCNGVDDDCDGSSDGGVLATWYRDADGDGWGDPASQVEECDTPEGYAPLAGDCDDTDPSRHPDAEEVCDGDDDDCDGRVDQGEATPWYEDGDGDGWGYPGSEVVTCEPEPGWLQVGGDCVDDDPSIHPGAPEACNHVDDDCDGWIDEDFDADDDGVTSLACPDGTDCDDGNPDVHPGADEACDNGIDEDCDGSDSWCGFSGTFSLADATAFLPAPGPIFAASNQLETGDATGDGIDDLLVATQGYDSMGGGAFVVAGPVSGTHTLDTVGWFIEYGAGAEAAGRSIGMGDADGDGLHDLLVGAPYARCGAFLVYAPVLDDLTLDDADVALRGGASYCGHGSDAGDITGDGLADVIVGDHVDVSNAGRIYVVHAPLPAEVDLPSASAAVIDGENPAAYAGRTVRTAPDTDGDGIGDLLIPAPQDSSAAPMSGSVYLVHGPATHVPTLASADGKMTGDGPGDAAGTFTDAGDLDGDGLADVVVGAPYHTSASTTGGTLYVVLGPATGTRALTTAEAVVEAADASSQLGLHLDVADVDGDGFADLLAGAPAWSDLGAGQGAAFLFRGPLSGTLTTAEASAVFPGASAADIAGQSVALGDIDGDGAGDVVVGAPGETTMGASSGAVFVQVNE